MDLSGRKQRAAGLSVASNTLLVTGKFAVGIATGSVSIISEAIHSGIDLIAAIVALLAVRESGKPPDEDHPFGHGKAEGISGAFEGLLIFMAIFIIVYEAFMKIISGSGVQRLDLGLYVMGASAIINILVSRQLFRVARRTESLALEADALHLSTDVFTSAGVFAGLLFIKLTGFHVLDPIIAIGVALVIGHAAWGIMRRSLSDLMDRRLSGEETAAIENVLSEHSGSYIGFHDLRSRKSGSVREVDLHLVLSSDINLAEAHAVCDHIEEELGQKIPKLHVTIHVEPCETKSTQSREFCRREQNRLFRHILNK